MVEHSLSTLDVTSPDLTVLWEAYLSIVTFSPSYPSFYRVYNHYVALMEGRRSSWQAQFYGDDFYDGAPGKVPKRMPDALTGIHDPFRVMDIDIVRTLLNRHQMLYSIHHVAYNAPVVQVW